MDTFLSVSRKSTYVGISIDPTKLSLCSMRSTLTELFVAPPTRFRLASLVNKHRFCLHTTTIRQPMVTA